MIAGPPVQIPAPDASIEEKAAFWLKHGRSTLAALYDIRRELTAHMMQSGELDGFSISYDYDWLPDTGAEFPELVREYNVSVAVEDPKLYEQIISLLTEQAPAAKLKAGNKIDSRKANKLIIHAKPEVANRLRLLRVEKPSLEVK